MKEICTMHTTSLRPSHHPHLGRFLIVTVCLVLLLILSISAAALL